MTRKKTKIKYLSASFAIAVSTQVISPHITHAQDNTLYNKVTNEKSTAHSDNLSQDNSNQKDSDNTNQPSNSSNSANNEGKDNRPNKPSDGTDNGGKDNRPNKPSDGTDNEGKDNKPNKPSDGTDNGGKDNRPNKPSDGTDNEGKDNKPNKPSDGTDNGGKDNKPNKPSDGTDNGGKDNKPNKPSDGTDNGGKDNKPNKPSDGTDHGGKDNKPSDGKDNGGTPSHPQPPTQNGGHGHKPTNQPNNKDNNNGQNNGNGNQGWNTSNGQQYPQNGEKTDHNVSDDFINQINGRGHDSGRNSSSYFPRNHYDEGPVANNQRQSIMKRFKSLAIGSFKYNPFIIEQVNKLGESGNQVSDQDLYALFRKQNFSGNSYLNSLQRGSNYFRFEYFNPTNSSKYYKNLDEQVLALITGEIGSMPDLKKPVDKKGEDNHTQRSEDKIISAEGEDHKQGMTDVKFNRLNITLIGSMCVIFVAVMVYWFINRQKEKEQ